MIFILLGLAAIAGGTKWLVILIPLAILVWYGVGSSWRTGRN